MRRAAVHANVLPRLLRDDGNSPQLVEAPHCCFVFRLLIVLEGV